MLRGQQELNLEVEYLIQLITDRLAVAVELVTMAVAVEVITMELEAVADQVMLTLL